MLKAKFTCVLVQTLRSFSLMTSHLHPLPGDPEDCCLNHSWEFRGALLIHHPAQFALCENSCTYSPAPAARRQQKNTSECDVSWPWLMHTPWIKHSAQLIWNDGVWGDQQRRFLHLRMLVSARTSTFAGKYPYSPDQTLLGRHWGASVKF